MCIRDRFTRAPFSAHPTGKVNACTPPQGLTALLLFIDAAEAAIHLVLMISYKYKNTLGEFRDSLRSEQIAYTVGAPNIFDSPDYRSVPELVLSRAY